MGRWLPEFFFVVAVISVVGNSIRGHPVFGLSLGALWLVAAYVSRHRREHSPWSSFRTK